MVLRFRTIVVSATILTTALVGWFGYSYFFDTSIPVLSLSGMRDGAYYAGDVNCIIASSKRGSLRIWCDDQLLSGGHEVARRGKEYPFTIPTRNLSNGQHTLKAELVDNTYSKHKSELSCTFYVDNVPLQAAFVQQDGDYRVLQGRTLHVQFQVNKPTVKTAVVKALAQSYDCFPEAKNSSVYECFIPISCEENPNEYLFTVDVTDQVGNTTHLENKFSIVLFPFKKQVIHVSEEKWREEKTQGKNSAELDQIMQDLTNQSPREKLWHGAFCTPIDIVKISCDFGVVRTTQERGRSVHKALDVVNTPKSVVWAPQSGVVVLKDRYNIHGNTVVIDHGFGVLTLLCHLDSFADINVGQKIAKGNPIGTLGKTGYASGYHLHWEMRVNNMQVDPMQWTKTHF